MAVQYVSEGVFSPEKFDNVVAEWPQPGPETTAYFVELNRKAMVRVYRDEVRQMYGLK